MTTIDKEIIVPVKADTSGFTQALDDLKKQSNSFGTAFTSTIKSAVISGKSFEDTLKTLALRLSNMALSAGVKPLENIVSGAFNSVLGGLTSASSIGQGGTGIVPFAKGGVVSSPAFFGSGRQVGVMGEAGAEAIMPLARGSDGRMGVRMNGASSSPNVVVNVTTPDVRGFSKSQGQIAALLARTVGRGRRSL